MRRCLVCTPPPLPCPPQVSAAKGRAEGEADALAAKARQLQERLQATEAAAQAQVCMLMSWVPAQQWGGERGPPVCSARLQGCFVRARAGLGGPPRTAWKQ